MDTTWTDDDDCIPDAVPLNAKPETSAFDTGSLKAAVTESVQVSKPRDQPAVPVLLLSGFLGAGKTTLVNYILTAKHGYRCAVLLNEIADTADVEKALVKEPEGSEARALADWVELENGCICCAVKNDFVQALESLVAQRDKFDYVLIETTGLANPAPVAAALWTDPELEAAVYLDAVVTVVDARHIRNQLEMEEAQFQVACADVILMNKVDLVTNTEVDSLKRDLLTVNSEATIIPSIRCAIDLEKVLHTQAYGAVARRGRDEHHHSGHTHGIHAVTVRCNKPLCLNKVREWLDEILWEEGSNRLIVRVKGLLRVYRSDRAWIIQAVHDLYDVIEGPQWNHDGNESKIAFIGRNLDEKWLLRGLEGCSALTVKDDLQAVGFISKDEINRNANSN